MNTVKRAVALGILLIAAAGFGMQGQAVTAQGERCAIVGQLSPITSDPVMPESNDAVPSLPEAVDSAEPITADRATAEALGGGNGTVLMPEEPEAPVEAAVNTMSLEMPQAQPAMEAAPTMEAAPVPADDGIWHIQYVDSRGAVSAPADGSIGLWADGWFIAHSHMANGDKIASFPPKVEVDGKLFHLQDVWVASDELEVSELVRIRQHDGIVFQTCITDTTNWMVYYEPDSAGYGYQFTSFPYTASDPFYLGEYGELSAFEAPSFESFEEI